jgi:drug/metabolite transporter (DMT)-like permease
MWVASLSLIVFYAWSAPSVFKKIYRQPPWLMVVGALLLAFNYYGYMKGVELTTASNSQIMIQLGPILLLLTGIFYFGERLKLLQWAGVVGAALGFVLFFFDQAQLSFSNLGQYQEGDIWLAGAATSWTFFAVSQKLMLKKNWRPGELNLVTYFVCAVALTFAADFSELPSVTWTQWVLLTSLGLNTVVAYGGFTRAMSLIPASQVSLIVTCNPLLTIALIQASEAMGHPVIPSEPLGLRGVLGALLVVGGVALAVGAPLLLKVRRERRAAARASTT